MAVARCKLLLLVAGLLASLALACQRPAHPKAKGDAGAIAALPAALAQLLPPLPGADSAFRRADVARLQATRAQWAGDSLGRLLVCSRLALDLKQLQLHGVAHHYQCLAWETVSPRRRRQYPVYVVSLAMALGHHYYGRGSYDSARTYYQQAIATFRAAGFDSSQVPLHSVVLPTTDLWDQGKTYAGSLASMGLVSRHLGNLAETLHYYERAAALYQEWQDLTGLSWMQSLVGEAQAEQGNYAQACQAYEQALRTVRASARRDPSSGSELLAGLVLDYYAPLLLGEPRQYAYASQLASEAADGLLSLLPASASVPASQQMRLAQLRLIPAEAALRAGQPAAASRWLNEADQRLQQVAAATKGSNERESDYAVVQAMTAGLRAWQQHAAHPAEARRRLARATALLSGMRAYRSQRRWRQQLATYCLAMNEPGYAARLLRPLVPLFQQQRGALPLSQVADLLSQAYAEAGRYDSAYRYSRRARALADTVRAARQFAALAATEARFRTREQASQIRLLTAQEHQQALRTSVAAGGAALFGLALLATALAWRGTRRFNRQLAAQGALLQDQATRLGELDEAKNQFFANVSHELRTPLTLIMGPLEGLLSAPPRALPAAVQQPVALAYRHTQRLRELVNRILDLTKLQAGRLALQPVPTALAPLLRRVVAQFESLAAQRGVALRGPAALPEELRLLLDADKVEQILTNLLINALNHTPTGGSVAVETQLPGPDGQYVVTVRDTGPGIAAGEQARIFERYYQSPQAQAQGGTGLGLPLSRELAQLLGGTLTVASGVGQGAAFTLRFPAPELRTEREAERVAESEVEMEAVAAEPPTLVASCPAPGSQEVPPDATKPRVLVVEDQPDLRDYLRQLLAPSCEVLTAPDGQAALELLARENPVDLITTDAMMPRLSGTELLTRLRADPAQAVVPVLMLTARADEAHRLAALTVGVDDYLTKPFVASELLARVRALLARQQVRRHFAAQPPDELPAPPAAAPAPAPEAELSVVPDAPDAPARAAAQLARWQAQVAPLLADERFGPAELASLLNMSERTLYRRLGELAGLTPAAWLREMRLHRARVLLEAGNFGSVAAVAKAAGFGSAKHFAIIYAERFGCRPSSYPS